jgi:hypothetical protein
MGEEILSIAYFTAEGAVIISTLKIAHLIIF